MSGKYKYKINDKCRTKDCNFSAMFINVDVIVQIKVKLRWRKKKI